jgi:hypothetical protein
MSELDFQAERTQVAMSQFLDLLGNGDINLWRR